MEISDAAMRRIVQRREEQVIAAHQAERRTLIKSVEAMAAVGKEPTEREYVTYHCYMTVAGEEPLSYEDWVTSLMGGRDGNR